LWWSKFLTQAGSGSFSCCWGWVSHLWVWKISPKNPKFSISFPSDQKKDLFGSGQKIYRSKTGRPLIYHGSKVSSDQVGSGPISNTNWKILFSNKVMGYGWGSENCGVEMGPDLTRVYFWTAVNKRLWAESCLTRPNPSNKILTRSNQGQKLLIRSPNYCGVNHKPIGCQ